VDRPAGDREGRLIDLGPSGPTPLPLADYHPRAVEGPRSPSGWGDTRPEDLPLQQVPAEALSEVLDRRWRGGQPPGSGWRRWTVPADVTGGGLLPQDGAGSRRGDPEGPGSPHWTVAGPPAVGPGPRGRFCCSIGSLARCLRRGARFSSGAPEPASSGPVLAVVLFLQRPSSFVGGGHDSCSAGTVGGDPWSLAGLAWWLNPSDPGSLSPGGGKEEPTSGCSAHARGLRRARLNDPRARGREKVRGGVGRPSNPSAFAPAGGLAATPRGRGDELAGPERVAWSRAVAARG